MKLLIEKDNNNLLITTAILEDKEVFNDRETISYLLTSCIKFCREIGLDEHEIDNLMITSNMNYHKYYNK